MARKVRVEFEGALYHVMCRGDRRENIFEDDNDRARFLETLAQACQRTGWRIHAYVLMSNHWPMGQRVRADTSVGLRWLAVRLKMGSEGHVSRITGSLADLVDHPGRRSFERTLQQDSRKKD
jgi:hypothetical protein